MPNHIHLVISAFVPLPKVIRWLKVATSSRANQALGRNGPFWQREYYDYWIRSDREFHPITNYIKRNPVKAGLVAEPEDWPWSSANQRNFAVPGIAT